jgi:hypothetical protein
LKGGADFRRSIIAIDCAQKRAERDGFDDGGAMLYNWRGQGAAKGAGGVTHGAARRHGEAKGLTDDRPKPPSRLQPSSGFDLPKHG